MRIPLTGVTNLRGLRSASINQNGALYNMSWHATAEGGWYVVFSPDMYLVSWDLIVQWDQLKSVHDQLDVDNKWWHEVITPHFTSKDGVTRWRVNGDLWLDYQDPFFL